MNIFLYFLLVFWFSDNGATLRSDELTHNMYTMPQDSIRLQGTMISSAADSITEIGLHIPTFATMDPIYREVVLDGNGKFEVWLPATEGVQEVVLMVSGKFSKHVYLHRGLELTMDAGHLEQVEFESEDAQLNEDFYRYEHQMEDLHIQLPDSLKEDLNGQSNFLKSEYEKRLASDIDYFKKHPSPMKDVLLEQRTSGYYAQLLSLYWPKNKVLPTEWSNEIYAYIPDNTTLSSTIFYFQLHTYIKRSLVFAEYVKDSKPVFEEADWETIYSYKIPAAEAKVTEAERTSFYTNEIMLFLFLKMKEYGESHFEGRHLERILLPVNTANDEQYNLIYTHVFSTIKTPLYRSVVSNRIQASLPALAHLDLKLSQLEKLNHVAPFGTLLYKTDFGAELYVVDTSDEANFVQLLRKHFNHSPLLFDFWAVWCVPCIAAMPHSKQLQQAIQDLPFIYVCTSNSASQESWVKKILDLEQPGIHLFVPEEMVGRWMRTWGLAGYPSVALYRADKSTPEELKNFYQISENQLRQALNK